MRKTIVVLSVLIIAINFTGSAQFQEETKVGISGSFKTYMVTPSISFPVVGGMTKSSTDFGTLKTNLGFGSLEVGEEDVPGMLTLMDASFYPSLLEVKFMNKKMNLNLGAGISIEQLRVEKETDKLNKIAEITQDFKGTVNLSFEVLEALSLEMKVNTNLSELTALQLQLGVWI